MRILEKFFNKRKNEHKLIRKCKIFTDYDEGFTNIDQLKNLTFHQILEIYNQIKYDLSLLRSLFETESIAVKLNLDFNKVNYIIDNELKITEAISI